MLALSTRSSQVDTQKMPQPPAKYPFLLGVPCEFAQASHRKVQVPSQRINFPLHLNVFELFSNKHFLRREETLL